MLTGKYDVHCIIFKLSYPVVRERERDSKRRILGVLWCTPHFMQDRKSKNYNFTINYMNHKTVGTLRDNKRPEV